MNSILYVGMDVHKENYTLCCYSFDRDKVEYRQMVPSDYRLILKYLWSRCAGNIRKKWNSSADMRPGVSVIRSIISSSTTVSNASSSRRPPWALPIQTGSRPTERMPLTLPDVWLSTPTARSMCRTAKTMRSRNNKNDICSRRSNGNGYFV